MQVENEYVFAEVDGSLQAVPVESAANLTVKTVQSKNIGSGSATFEGEVTEMEGIESVDVYFRWLKRGEDPPKYETSKQTLNSTGSFTADLSGLEYDDYTLWAVAETANKTLKGRLKAFSTT